MSRQGAFWPGHASRNFTLGRLWDEDIWNVEMAHVVIYLHKYNIFVFKDVSENVCGDVVFRDDWMTILAY